MSVASLAHSIPPGALVAYLGQIFPPEGRKGREVATINQNYQERSVLNKVDKLPKLRMFYWLEIRHFAELRYFRPVLDDWNYLSTGY